MNLSMKKEFDKKSYQMAQILSYIIYLEDINIQMLKQK